MDFLDACLEITQNKNICSSNPPAIVLQNPILICPFEDLLQCAGFYDRLTNTIYLKPYKDKVFFNSVLLHEVCHWLDDYKGCGCDPYEVQRRYLLSKGSIQDWFSYLNFHHNKKRECTYGPGILR